MSNEDEISRELLCSVKSSLSYKLDVEGILKICTIASNKSELRDINIQVYFWLTIDPKNGDSRLTVPSLRQAAIIGWFGRKDLHDFIEYKHEHGRKAAVKKLNTGRTMTSLLKLIK